MSGGSKHHCVIILYGRANRVLGDRADRTDRDEETTTVYCVVVRPRLTVKAPKLRDRFNVCAGLTTYAYRDKAFYGVPPAGPRRRPYEYDSVSTRPET